MTARDRIEQTNLLDVNQRHARYHTAENPFTFAWPDVPIHQFLAERKMAFDGATPTRAIALDISSILDTPYPATTPSLLTRYLRIRAGEMLETMFVAGGEVYYVIAGSGESGNARDCIRWSAGDVLCLPGGNRTTHRAAAENCILFVATDEPLLALEGLSAPTAASARVKATHWPHRIIEQQFEAVFARAVSDTATGCSVMFTGAAPIQGYMTTPIMNVAINTLAAGRDQRPHRHNGVAVTLAIEGTGVHSMINGQRIDWSNGAAQITPATTLHSHHNRGPHRMRSLVIQDEGLHHYLRTPGFSFD
ncbi:MAG TPA: cupin domain-containing protein [Burkholderiales bacterium]|nr:cupin domain-containing protein [Burkholderiales bacterium]